MALPRSEDRAPSDEELALAAQQDPRQFGQLYDRYFDRVFRFLALRAQTRELAEDLAAQAFLNALEHIGSYRPSAPFGAWIFRIARNLLIDAYRVSGRTTSLSDDLPLPYDAMIPERTERVLQKEALDRALAGLSDTEREVLMLRVGGDLRHEEIASALGKSEAAVKVAYSRAVQRLRSLLADPPDDPADVTA